MNSWQKEPHCFTCLTSNKYDKPILLLIGRTAFPVGDTLVKENKLIFQNGDLKRLSLWNKRPPICWQVSLNIILLHDSHSEFQWNFIAAVSLMTLCENLFQWYLFLFFAIYFDGWLK